MVGPAKKREQKRENHKIEVNMTLLFTNNLVLKNAYWVLALETTVTKRGLKNKKAID
jgi:hypothetical protein